VVAVFEGSPTAGWDNGAPPDILYLSAVGALTHSKWTGADVVTSVGLLPGERHPLPLPELEPRPAAPRDVVFVLTESVRATDACSAFDPACASTPFTNEALPARFGFREMRSVDSTTALSLAVLWSGLLPTASREALHSAPLVWEYAHAGGLDTAYWTSQNLLFANAGRWLEGVPLSRFVSGTEIDPYATYQCGADDAALVRRALGGIATLRSPFFAVLHLSNTHFPYWAEDGYRKGSEDVRDETLARYRSSIRRQDRIVAGFLEALRKTPTGARAVVVFASDHGEQIYERGQEGHTWSLYEEEIRVPMWIDAPPGTLSPVEAETLRSLEATPLTTLDVLPTLLDLVGVWDARGLAAFRASMPGASLLRGGTPPDRPTVMSNCSDLFACATKNWGAMRWPLKLIATEDEDDGAWRCFDVVRDPGETTDLGVDACVGLRDLAEGEGRGSPR
jgi:Sulfatase